MSIKSVRGGALINFTRVAVVCVAVAVALMTSLAGATSGGTSSRTYTSDADFDTGEYANVVHSSPGRLQLNDFRRVVNVIWIPGMGTMMGTVLKIDADSGTILGEYRTAPASLYQAFPQHTTTDSKGSAWVANFLVSFPPPVGPF